MYLASRYFSENLVPRPPYDQEFVEFAKRSVYYEVFLATSTLTASVLLIVSLEYLFAKRCLLGVKKLGFANFTQCLTDASQFLLIVVPFQFATLDYPVSSYQKFVLLYDAACCILCATCILHRRCRLGREGRLQDKSADTEPISTAGHRPHNDFLTVFRSVVYLFTAVCIFARDQPCWRNAFSKADSFGTGLMDIGLGLFVVCIGSLGPTVARRLAEVDRPAAMRKAGAQFLLLTGCGMVKSISVAIVIATRDIKFENVWREYGVHWNAFYSLAVAKLGGTALELYVLPARLSPLLAAAAAGLGHEVLLAYVGLADYVLAPGQKEPVKRHSGLLDANREGVCSAPGLMAMYLVGAQLGRWTTEWSRLPPGRRLAGMPRLARRLAALLSGCLAYRVLLAHLPGLLLPESRRLLNLSYSLWVAAFSASCLASVGLMLSARLALPGGQGDRRLAPLHLARVDSAGLLYFLVSNLLTALANLLIRWAFPDRESTDGPLCFCLVLLYMAAVHPTAWLTQRMISVRAVMDRLTACLTWSTALMRPRSQASTS